MAYRMVTEFGFSKNIGPFSYAGLPDRDRRIADHPEAIAEAREIIKALERECAELLLANRAALERLTAELLEHEDVSGEVVDDVPRGRGRQEGGAARGIDHAGRGLLRVPGELLAGSCKTFPSQVRGKASCWNVLAACRVLSACPASCPILPAPSGN